MNVYLQHKFIPPCLGGGHPKHLITKGLHGPHCGYFFDHRGAL